MQTHEEFSSASKLPVPGHRLQLCLPQTIQQYLDSTSTARRQDTGTHFPSMTISMHNSYHAKQTVRSAERKSDHCKVFREHLAREFLLRDTEDTVSRSSQEVENSLSSATTLTSTPKSVVAGQAFMTETWERFYQSLNIKPGLAGAKYTVAKPSGGSSQPLAGTTQDHAQLHQGRNSSCLAQEGHTQTTCQGRCNCQEPDRHLWGVAPLEGAFASRSAGFISSSVSQHLRN